MVGLCFTYQKYIPQLETPRIRSYFPFLAYSYIYNYPGGTKGLGKPTGCHIMAPRECLWVASNRA